MIGKGTAGIIIGFILIADLGIQQVNYAEETNIAPDAANFLGKFSGYLSEVAEAVKPSVVNISTTKTVTMQQSPAAQALKRNDVIQEINKKVIKNTKDYEKAVSKIGPDDTVLILAYRAGGYIYITIKP
ncbi:MAG TPA: PDZ domain-containing protein [Nitrospirae bacterium]|nr:PDZ domain-containing protein [Nitrospirota bacterium]